MIGAAVAAAALCTVSPEPAGVTPDPSAAVDTLGGFRLGYLPGGLGPMVSDFAYEWDDVSFRTRTWERVSTTAES